MDADSLAGALTGGGIGGVAVLAVTAIVSSLRAGGSTVWGTLERRQLEIMELLRKETADCERRLAAALGEAEQAKTEASHAKAVSFTAQEAAAKATEVAAAALSEANAATRRVRRLTGGHDVTGAHQIQPRPEAE